MTDLAGFGSEITVEAYLALLSAGLGLSIGVVGVNALFYAGISRRIGIVDRGLLGACRHAAD